MFAALGTKVTLIDGRDTLLSFLDPDVSRALTAAMQSLGVTFLWHENVVRCDAPDELQVEILGDRRTARVLKAAPYDPDGMRLRV